VVAVWKSEKGDVGETQAEVRGEGEEGHEVGDKGEMTGESCGELKGDSDGWMETPAIL